jgi:hypothetical protein
MLYSLPTLTLLLTLLSPITSLSIRNFPPTEQTIIPSAAFIGDVTAQFTSTSNFLDGPKLSAVNSTSWDWWYFDVVSPNAKNSITVVFFAALDSGFPFLAPSTDVTVIGIYPIINGVLTAHFLNATSATITSTGQGASGVYAGTGAQWSGAPDLSQYTININSPETGVVGSICFKSAAPAHYPCGPAVAGQNMEVGPNIGWSNALPDADASVDFTLNGKRFAFEGVGYHDKNWSPQPFLDNVASWYWGHARLGPYSLVWFDFLAVTGIEYVSLYLSKNGQIISSSCTPGSLTVRPWGGDATYPPKVGSGFPAGFGIKANLGGGQTASFNVTSITQGLEITSLYTNWLGSVEGVVEGKSYTGGAALYEEFKVVA